MHPACHVMRPLAELTAIMAWLYVADRTDGVAKLLPWTVSHAPKVFSQDMFLFLIASSLALSTSTLSVTTSAHLLSRNQTDEWKGWMQLMFLLYHYYDAKEVYNIIRVFISAYVWMTGYGNFLYYAKTGNFAVSRLFGSLWRINFLAAVCCAVMGNSYMLYYICPLHTLFTLTVYAALAIAPATNASAAGRAIKILACCVVVAVCWEVQAVFDAVWTPLTFLVGYSSPHTAMQAAGQQQRANGTSSWTASETRAGELQSRRRAHLALDRHALHSSGQHDRMSHFQLPATPSSGAAATANLGGAPPLQPPGSPLLQHDRLHEWHFRSSLDRYIWIYGMACAACKPAVERMLDRIESMKPRVVARAMQSLLIGACLAMLAAWYVWFGSLPKAEYNAVHPFTSWMPITAYILLRNATAQLRRSNLSMFSCLGRVTLETYIAQFHTWLSTGGVHNGQPKALLHLLPDGYPMLNLLLCSAIFLTLSRRLFAVTDVLRSHVETLGARLAGGMWASDQAHLSFGRECETTQKLRCYDDGSKPKGGVRV